MLTLLTFPGSFGLPSHSPFCMKAMGMLTLSGAPWQAEYHMNPSKMPYGKLPVLRADGRLVPDSEGIRSYLEADGADLWAGHGSAMRAQGHLFIRLADLSLHDALVCARWLDPVVFPKVREAFFGTMPWPLKRVLPHVVRRQIAKTLQATGYARLSSEDRADRFERDLDALEHPLWERAFLLGDQPTAADCAVAPHLAMILALPEGHDLRNRLSARAPLVAYLKRTAPLFVLPEGHGSVESAVNAIPAAA